MDMEELRIRHEERLKAYDKIIGYCEKRKKRLMNLSIPMRTLSVSIIDEIIDYCNNHKTDTDEGK